eukprot:GHVS01026083.1.p1 GENE.GHVS01026083.1~~GHVS01026083.1.p1  ORF type:complete len:352 (+),score=41.08 GHVS01026083.1:295-1350(+)
MGNSIAIGAATKVPLGPEGEVVSVHFNQRLGNGGVGIVYPGNLCSDNSPVAVKVVHTLNTDKRAAIHRAVTQFGSCQHPNLVELLGCWSDGALTYVIEEKCYGGDLQAYMRARYALKLPEESAARELAVAVLNGLDCLHRQGWVHGDIKFENLMFSSEGSDDLSSLKIIDLDSARPQMEKAVASNITCTLQYAGPEVLDGVVTPATDVRAVGCLVYLMMEGRLPHRLSSKSYDILNGLCKCDNSNRQEIIKTLLRHPSFPRGISGKYSHACLDFIKGALHNDIKLRFKNASECLRHPWLRSSADVSEVSTSASSPNLTSSPLVTSFGSSLSSPAISFDSHLFLPDVVDLSN